MHEHPSIQDWCHQSDKWGHDLHWKSVQLFVDINLDLPPPTSFLSSLSVTKHCMPLSLLISASTPEILAQPSTLPVTGGKISQIFRTRPDFPTIPTPRPDASVLLQHGGGASHGVAAAATICKLHSWKTRLGQIHDLLLLCDVGGNSQWLVKERD